MTLKPIPKLFNGFHESFMPDVDEYYIFREEDHLLKGEKDWYCFVEILQLWYDFKLIEVIEVLADETPDIICYCAKITDKGKCYIDFMKL